MQFPGTRKITTTTKNAYVIDDTWTFAPKVLGYEAQHPLSQETLNLMANNRQGLKEKYGITLAQWVQRAPHLMEFYLQLQKWCKKNNYKICPYDYHVNSYSFNAGIGLFLMDKYNDTDTIFVLDIG